MGYGRRQAITLHTQGQAEDHLGRVPATENTTRAGPARAFVAAGHLTCCWAVEKQSGLGGLLKACSLPVTLHFQQLRCRKERQGKQGDIPGSACGKTASTVMTTASVGS